MIHEQLRKLNELKSKMAAMLNSIYNNNFTDIEQIFKYASINREIIIEEASIKQQDLDEEIKEMFVRGKSFRKNDE